MAMSGVTFCLSQAPGRTIGHPASHQNSSARDPRPCSMLQNGAVQQRTAPPASQLRRQSAWQVQLQLWQPRRARSRSLLCASGLDPEVLTDRDIPISKLQRLLEDAIDEEDYDAAAQLRDTIQRRRFDSRLAVEEANDRFYAAFTSGSLPAMAEIWGKGEHVQCVHPGANCIAGREAVMDSWRLILGTGRLKITLQDVRVYASESDGFVTCVEVVETSESRGGIMATNVFEKQDGKWKITHHHGSPAPRLL